jgi:glycyl-tRNA synthetase
MIAAWREHFVIEEGMYEVDCSILTPEPVLRASGHLQRFTDLMVRDLQTGDCFRADRLLADHSQKLLNDIQEHRASSPNEGGGKKSEPAKKKNNNSTKSVPLFDMSTWSEAEEERLRALVDGGAGALTPEELQAEMLRLKVRSPLTGNELSEVCMCVYVCESL